MSDNGNVWWNQPLEAVGPKGEVVPIELDPNYQNPNPSGHYTLLDLPAEGCYYTYTADGLSWMGDGEDGWRIRNVVQPKVMQDHMNAEGGTVRTTDEQLTHYAERCKALAQALADVPKDTVLGQSGYAAEARAIVASMVEVDPDEAEAIALAEQYGWSPEIAEGNACEIFLKAIKRGRALERGE